LPGQRSINVHKTHNSTRKLIFYILRKQGKGKKFFEKCSNLSDELILIKNLMRTLNFFPRPNQVVSFFERRQIFNIQQILTKIVPFFKFSTRFRCFKYYFSNTLQRVHYFVDIAIKNT